MEYKRFNDTIILRLNIGEEILSSINKVVEKENIRLAEINGLGATNNFTVGRMNLNTKEYEKTHMEGSFEIASLHGNVTAMNGNPYLHLHMVASGKDGVCYGGHLNEAFIGVTCEIIIRIIDGNVNRIKDEITGINIIKF